MGVNINTSNAPASGGSLINTGQLFVVAQTGSTGPQTAPALCHSISDVESAFGVRSTSGVTALWDYLDNFYREGGNQAYVIGYDSGSSGTPASALALIDPRLGPGQVAVVGAAPSSTIYGNVLSHCLNNNRVGLLDVAQTDITEAALAVEGALGVALTNPDRVGIFGTWVNIPAPNGVVGGSARVVPASSTIAALCNRVDQLGNPNVAPGGRDFPLQYGTSPLYDPTDAETATLLATGVNPIRERYSVLENYGFVTPIAKSTSTPFWQLNCARARMWLVAQAQLLGEAYYMKEIDGEGKLATELGADLNALCAQLYQAGGLYGDTAADAYNVNVGVTVNNSGSAAQGQLNATVEARFSQYADTVNITLVSVPIAGSVVPS